MVVVARHEEGITLNDYEYLLNEDGTVKEFNSKNEAIDFLRENGASNEEIYHYKFFDAETKEDVSTSDYFWEKYNPEYNQVLLNELREQEDTGSTLPEDMCSFGGCMYETYGAEYEHVYGVYKENPNRIWTIIDNNDGEPMWICAGLHIVNRIGYLITDNGWTDKYEEYVCE